MSELEHKCGIAFIRCLKEPEYYEERYPERDNLIFRLMRTLMLKQRNRGQDAAGIACGRIPYNKILLQEYLNFEKSTGRESVDKIFEKVFAKNMQGQSLADTWNPSIIIGHLLYSTMILDGVDERFIHPVERYSSDPRRRIALAMNGNFSNIRAIRGFLENQISRHIASPSDMEPLKELFGQYLDHERERAEVDVRARLTTPNPERVLAEISSAMDLRNVMKHVGMIISGGYALEGILGNGDGFFARDPHGIRPLHYFANEEFVAAASEAGALYSAFKRFGVDVDDIKTLPPGHIGIVKQDGEFKIKPFSNHTSDHLCSFEGVYFSRPNNPGVYDYRKKLGSILAEKVKELVGNRSCILSYVPNTSESAAIGLREGWEELLKNERKKLLGELAKSKDIDINKIQMILGMSAPPIEQVLTKDAKARTFISAKLGRAELIADSYDIVMDMLRKFEETDVTIIVEDSIVKGATLENNIIKTLAESGVKEVHVVSSCPQIRYVCPYGVEMARLKEFVAFRATVDLIKERGMQEKLDRLESAAREQQEKIEQDFAYVPERHLVQELYALVSEEDITSRIGKLITPESFDIKVGLVYPTVNEFKEAKQGINMGMACFDGNYPEVGGLRVSNKSLVDYFDNNDEKAY